MNKPAIGHVYVLELTGGLIKVGYSADVEFRVKRHASNIKKHGLAVVRHWVSPRHVEAGLNEEALIASCEMGGGVHFRPGEGSGLRRGREWFRGVEFDSVVARAASLNFTPCGDGEIGTTLEMARRSLGEIVNRAWLVGERTTITKQGKPAAVVVSVDWYEQAKALISGRNDE